MSRREEREEGGLAHGCLDSCTPLTLSLSLFLSHAQPPSPHTTAVPYSGSSWEGWGPEKAEEGRNKRAGREARAGSARWRVGGLVALVCSNERLPPVQEVLLSAAWEARADKMTRGSQEG